MTENIKCNDEYLTELQLIENFEWIKNIRKPLKGYDCSTCDPLFFLVCQLYNVSIHHNYNGHMIKYQNMNDVKPYIIRLKSNSEHMW